ncbi:unnamed protein product [Gongylonema pulchrum]|uniref:Intraflagellar transport protein 43 homolog n=1 Tax=Gongylonema pulchrum TaxID=637853 RepID=A0A183EP95_9BILA|nr:unnamed protein product [Gongylonema pulchrum]
MTPVSRKSRTYVKQEKANDLDMEEVEEDYTADKTLNRSLDEFDIMEESYMGEQEPALLPKDLDGMQCALLQWLRKDENSSLYNQLLGLNVISFVSLSSFR